MEKLTTTSSQPSPVGYDRAHFFEEPNMAKNKIVINKNTGVVTVNVTGKAASKHTGKQTRTKLRKKLDDKQPLGDAAPERETEKPEDLDLSNLTHFSNNCIANHLVSAGWSQEPMVRFQRRTKTVIMRESDGYTGILYQDLLKFNDWSLRLLGLRPGMKLALFTDRKDYPRYFVIQNVVTSYEAPAHLHRLGTFELKANKRKDACHTHVCKPGTETHIAYIGHEKYEKYPVALLEELKHLDDHEMPLWRLKDEPDIIIGRFSDMRRVPEKLVDKLTRIEVPLLESDHRPTNRIARSERSGRLEDFIPSTN